MAEPRVPRLELPFFRRYLGRSVATRSWQKLMRKEIRIEVDNGQLGSSAWHGGLPVKGGSYPVVLIYGPKQLALA